MQHCAGLRRPGAAALDLCYVAAGWYDGFFETGLSPWDIAAGSLMVTEAGGLIGNFTGDSDYLYQREIIAGNPKIYGQLVSILAPYTSVGKSEDGAVTEAARDATAAFVASSLAGQPSVAAKKPALRIRKSDAAKPRDDDAPL
jgi:myo-inositol-1(or 4)-monophosphatase